MINPIVAKSLEFYPHEAPYNGITTLYQCFKWREDLSRELRVQMVWNHKHHFYIYEPTSLMSGEIVIPIFFFKSKNQTYAKCIRPTFHLCRSTSKLVLVIPANLTFNSPDIVCEDINDFEQPYSEIILEDGTPLAEACKIILGM